MNRVLSAVFCGLVVGVVLIPGTTSDPLEICQPRNSTYNIGDSKQCDKYWVCPKSGLLEHRLCADGFVYSLEINQCSYPHDVDCEKRPILQPTTSTHPNCPRSNGFYPYPPETSCQQFYHCLEGVPYEKTCPEGVIFDPARGTCMHPDMSKRPECSAKEVLNFICPNSVNRFAKLKFGDHDRHRNPKDCKMFFICLKSGKPRIGGCPGGMVFNGETGYCDKPEVVKGCESYYGSQDTAQLRKDSDSEGFDFDGDFDNEVEQPLSVPFLPVVVGKPGQKSPKINKNKFSSQTKNNASHPDPNVNVNDDTPSVKSQRHAPGFRHGHQGQGQSGFFPGEQDLGRQQFGEQNLGRQQFGEPFHGNQQQQPQFGQQFPGQNFNQGQRRYRREEEEEDENKEEKKITKIKRDVAEGKEKQGGKTHHETDTDGDSD